MRFHDLLLFALPVACFLGVALVVLLLAFGQPDFALDATSHEMQVDGHQRVAGAFDLADQLADFGSIEQQLAGAQGFRMHMGGSTQQCADVGAEQENFAAARNHIGFLELHPPGADCLDFPAMKNDTCFEAILDKVVMESFSVINYGHVLGQ